MIWKVCIFVILRIVQNQITGEIIPPYPLYLKERQEFASTLPQNVLLLMEPINSSSASQADYFWSQFLQFSASMTTLQTYFTLLDRQCPFEGSSMREAILKTKTEMISALFNDIEEFDPRMFDYGATYPRTMRFRIGVFDLNAVAADESIKKVEGYIEGVCDSSNMKLLTTTSWYLASQRLWLKVIQYPDGERMCEVAVVASDAEDADGVYSEHQRPRNPARQNFKGHSLVVSTVKYEPFVVYDERFVINSTVDPNAVTGSDFDLLRLFQSRLNFTIKAVIPKDEDWGADEGNGSWTGIIGMVQRNEADVGASGLVVGSTAAVAIKYLQSMEDECLHVWTRRPLTLRAKELFALFSPFPAWLWATLCFLTVLMATAGHLIEKARGIRRADWAYHVLMYYSAQVGLGAPDERLQAAAGDMMRAIWMCWLWFSFIISSAYTSFLVSSLTIPMYQRIPTTLKEFISSEFSIGRVQWGDAIDDMILKANDSEYPELRKKIIWLDRDAWDAWKPIHTIDHSFAIIEQSSDAFFAIMTGGPKNFMLSEAKWACSPISWAVQWNGIFNEPLDALLKPMARFGILQKVRQRDRDNKFKNNMTLLLEYYSGRRQGSTGLAGEASEIMDFQDFISVFMVLGIGYGCSLMAFIGELALYHSTCARSGVPAFYT